MKLQGKLLLFWILAVILLGAAVLRLYNLEEESLWLDECFTLDYASQSFTELVETLKIDVHPIGYYIPQHFLMDHFGSGEFVLRIISVFFGVLSVYLTYLLGKKFFSWKEGLLASFFMAISYTSILYSQEAKMYSMFAAFFLLSLYFFINFLEKPSYRNVLLFSVSSALLLYTHIISLMILVGFVLFYLFLMVIERKKSTFALDFFAKYKTSNKFILGLFIIFLLYLPWLTILVEYQLPLLYHFLGAKLIEKLGLNLLPVVVAVVIVVAFLYFILLYSISTDKINLNRLFDYVRRLSNLVFTDSVLSVVILSFIILDFVLSTYLFSSVSLIRFGFFMLPLLYLLLSRMLLKMKKHYLAVILFTLLILSASVELYTYYNIDSKEQFREAAQYIQEEASPDDVLFLHRATMTKVCFDYYYSGSIEKVRLINPGIDDRLLVDKAAGKEHAYLLLSHNYHTQDYFPSRMDSLYDLESEKDLIGIKIYKYKLEK